MSVVQRQRVIWNGQVLEVPFTTGATAGQLTAMLQGTPELGLFDMGGVQLAPGEMLRGGLDELVLRPVYIH